MIRIEENIPLAPYTTFKIGGPARLFCIVRKEDELLEAVKFAKEQKLRFMVLGGGSNILVSDAGFDGLVIKNEIMGIEASPENMPHRGPPSPPSGGAAASRPPSRPPRAPLKGMFSFEASNSFLVSVGAGENWDSFVGLTVKKNLYGLENLSAIPGTVGAAPVQNIGAYGAEVGNCIGSVRALDTMAMKFVDLSNEQCQFDYRDSLFKHQKNKYIITKVNFIFKKEGEIDISYKDLKEYFKNDELASIPNVPTIKKVRQAVMKIRRKKLPNWKLWGTAGSFFKNPIISSEHCAELKIKYPDLPVFSQPDGRVKVSAGWILDKICKARGIMKGNVGAYENQALVLITKPSATALEVVDFANELMNQIERETGIKIECEVQWVN